MLRNTVRYLMLMPNVMKETRNITALTWHCNKSAKESCTSSGRPISYWSRILTVNANALHSLDSKRNIYSSEDLAKDFYEHLERTKARFENISEMRESIETDFRESGITKLLNSDLENLILIAENKSHLEVVADIIRAFFEDDYRLNAAQKASHIHDFLHLCHKLNEIDIAKEFWNHNNINKLGVKWTEIFYFSYLFENGHYKEIIEYYNKLSDQAKDDVEPLSVVVLAALAKIETKVALEQMCDILDKRYKEYSINHKGLSAALCSWVAYKLKNFGFAYDILISRVDENMSHVDGFKGVINMKLAILLEIEKIDEVTIFLRKLLQSANDNPNRKIIICFNIMKKYTDAIKKRNEQKFTTNAIQICQELDAKTDLTDLPLEELVFVKQRINRLPKNDKKGKGKTKKYKLYKLENTNQEKYNSK